MVTIFLNVGANILIGRRFLNSGLEACFAICSSQLVMSACLQYKDEEALKTTIMEKKANKCCLCSAVTETFADMENHIVTLHPDIFRGTPVKPIAKHPDGVEKKTKIRRPDHSGAKSLKREGAPGKQLQTLIIYFNCSDTMTYFFQQSNLT